MLKFDRSGASVGPFKALQVQSGCLEEASMGAAPLGDDLVAFVNIQICSLSSSDSLKEYQLSHTDEAFLFPFSSLEPVPVTTQETHTHTHKLEYNPMHLIMFWKAIVSLC